MIGDEAKTTCTRKARRCWARAHIWLRGRFGCRVLVHPHQFVAVVQLEILSRDFEATPT